MKKLLFILLCIIAPYIAIFFLWKRTNSKVLRSIVLGWAMIVIITAAISNNGTTKKVNVPSKNSKLEASDTGGIGKTQSDKPETKTHTKQNQTNSDTKKSTKKSTNQTTDTPNTQAPAKSKTTSESSKNSGTKSQSKQCRDNPMAGVYHPSRLIIKNPCKTVSGTVADVKHEADHDYHIRLKLDNTFKDLLNSGNYNIQHGDLVVEVIPMDEGKVPDVHVGNHITVTGSYVKDGKHGWMEIHPAWFINGKGTVKYTQQEADQSVQTGVCGNGDQDCEEHDTNANQGSSSSTSSKGSVTITNVDLSNEVVNVKNNSSKDIAMTGWTLLSVTGHQTYHFPSGFILKDGASVKIESGRKAVNNPPNVLLWSHEYIWNNDGDPAKLLNPSGKVVSVFK